MTYKAVGETGPDRTEKRKLRERAGRTEKMKFCPDCKRVWEIARSTNHNSKGKLIYYHNFPTIGKPHELCPECKIKLDKTLSF